MAKYKGAYREELDKDEMSYSQEMAAQQQEPPAQTPEDETYKKRYGDLRRHNQHLMSQKEQEIAQLKSQLDQATRQQIRFPKNDEEVDAWSKKYPEVAAIVDTIARKRANEALEEGERRLGHLSKLEQKFNRREAEQQLHHYHPDFNDIRNDPKFHEWVTMQPQVIKDSLYKNSTDVLAAARALDLFKADTGRKTKRSKSAAQSVGRSSATNPGDTGKPKWSESQVNRMTDREYEANEEAILTAMRTGNFVYDMTGNAR